ncbi:hypothetical protein P389DRAFT_170491 [Cystobasidium minutum MCA 4210]|uniref:uncharacterized protein n=1 Tax=Cystobasidium minutum MCA 4210 TaxID=1397322 RepID=UPI0034CF3E15|eukprot:jgi/Rhomi1/170491/fgenesh1_kg.4_\
MAPPVKQNSHRAARKKKKSSFFKRHHAALMVVVVTGWLVPPLAVFIRFGIGIDFFLNIIFTCLGYIPGHVHNYYLQYIRNNYGRGRTPKWALRAGLVEDNTAYVKSTRQWGNRYDERNPNNVYDDPTAPYQDEFGNTIEPQGWVEEHGIRPSQPGAGFGPDGNALHPEEDLLAGLPDEERERRRRAKRLHQREYGAGLEDLDREEQERRRVAANGGGSGSGNGYARGNDLIDDLPEDPDIAMYRREQQPRSSKKGGRFSSFGSSSNQADEEPAGSRWGGGSSSKKSGRAKKSERYGIREDHADLGGSYGRSSSSKNASSKVSKGRSYSQNDYQPRPSNDRYDIVDDEPSSGRRRNNDDEDFLNHQF